MHSTRGVSLVELMIALAVIAIALLGIVGVFLNTLSVKEANREQQIAKTAATRRLEEIRTAAQTDFGTVATTYANTTFSISELSNPATADKRGLGTVLIDSSNSNLLDVRVLITWAGVRGDSRYEVRSLLTR